MLTEYDDAGSFLDATRSMWEPREAELGLLVGIAGMVQDGTIRCRDALFATIDGAAVMRTPPHGFIVAVDRAGAADRIARAIAQSGRHRDSPLVIATRPHGGEFAAAWADETSRTASLTTAQRILATTQVRTPPSPQGTFRAATLADADVVAPWFHDFAIEAMPHEAGERAAAIAMARNRIGRGNVFLWEDTVGPVSMAALTRPTPNGITVNSVYTPPAHRGRGFASACVAAVTQRGLTQKRFVSLYTDAANPTSNAMYERLGYELVCASELFSFA